MTLPTAAAAGSPRTVRRPPAAAGEARRRERAERDAAPAPPDQQAALLAEAANKSGLLWVDVPGDRAWPAWHVWVEGTAYVVSGPGSRRSPPCRRTWSSSCAARTPAAGCCGSPARAEPLTPQDPRWEPATSALKAARLDAPAGDVVGRWAAEATVTALVPQLPLLEGPGGYDDASGAAAPAPTPATTRTWQPWHLKGRPKRRRGTR